ncbi:MAG TPA: hypothetical protein VKP69_19515, partial [Isosphaeraceae bacterium]|nr:hypothetical protein [Isosphaeraceae bacterium]
MIKIERHETPVSDGFYAISASDFIPRPLADPEELLSEPTTEPHGLVAGPRKTARLCESFLGAQLSNSSGILFPP